MENVIGKIETGIALASNLCDVGIAFFGITKKIGKALVSISDKVIDGLKEVKKDIDVL